MGDNSALTALIDYTDESLCSSSPSQSCCTEEEVEDYYRERDDLKATTFLREIVKEQDNVGGTWEQLADAIDADKKKQVNNSRSAGVEQRKAQMNRGFFGRLFGKKNSLA